MEIFDQGPGAIEIIEMEPSVEVENLGARTLPGALMPMLQEHMQEESGESDWENGKDHNKFLAYLHQKMEHLPKHRGSTTVGCARAISFLKRLDKEISQAIRSDEDNVIDEDEAEELRDTIMDYIEKLEEGYAELMDNKKPKKKAAMVMVGKEVVARIHDGVDIKYYIPVSRDDDESLLEVKVAEPTDEQVQLFVAGEDNSNFTKEAGRARIVLVEDPFLHSITRILINSSISAGRNIEEVYERLKKKYSFTSREELSIQELLLQKGMPIFKDLGRLGEPADPADGDGVEYSTVYYA